MKLSLCVCYLNFFLTLRSFPKLFLTFSVWLCLLVWVVSSQWEDTSLWLSPSGPGSYNKNNEQLLCSFVAKAKQGLQERLTTEVKAERWLALSSSPMHTLTHTHFLISYICPQCIRVTMATWSSTANGWDFFDEVLTKVYWSTWFDAFSREKILFCLVEKCDRSKEIPGNKLDEFILFRYSRFMFCLSVIFGLLFVPVDHSQCIWLHFVYWVCMCVCVFHGYFLWLCLCIRDDSWVSVLLRREKIHTINLPFSNTLSHS